MEQSEARAMGIEWRVARFYLALKVALLREIALQRREYMSEEPDGSWATRDARELEMWGHRHVQPVSMTMEGDYQ